MLLILCAALFRKRGRRQRSPKADSYTPLPQPSGGTKQGVASMESGRPTPALDSNDERAHPAIPAAKLDRLVASVKTAVADDPALVAGVLRNWLEERS